MHVHARLLLLVFLLIGFFPATGAAQDERVVALERRIEQLEVVISRLTERIVALEAQLRAAPSTATVPAQTGNWQNRANWRQLQRGMSMEDVTTLLGEPHTVEANIAFILWDWGQFPSRGRVQFDADTRRVDGWTEPPR